MVLAWSVDRIARSLEHLIGFLDELHAKRVDLYLDQQGIDTTTPAGKAMFQMCGVFAEFEHAMIQERVKAGLARARGCPWRQTWPAANFDPHRAGAPRGQGRRIVDQAIAARCGVSTGTVVNVLKKERACR